MDLPTDVLRTFVTAADSGSYTDAAAIVHRTQSAVSMQIKRLEDLVGRALFMRNGRRMTLTSEGQNLLMHARRILTVHDEAVSALKHPEISGRVRLGAPDDYAERLLPLLLSRFARTHPLVEVEVSCQPTASMLELIDSGKLDLLIHGNSDIPTRGETLCRDQLVWITSQQHLVHEQDPVPLAVYNCGCMYRQWAIQSLKGVNKSYRIAYSSQSKTGIFAAVKSGLAITAAGRSTIPDDVKIIGPSEGFPELPAIVITLIKSKNTLHQPAEILAKYVAESFSELTHS